MDLLSHLLQSMVMANLAPPSHKLPAVKDITTTKIKYTLSRIEEHSLQIHLKRLPGIDLKVLLSEQLVRSSSSRSAELTSEKYVVTTVLSANFRPASACIALRADSALSYLTNILPTPFDCRLPPLGLGIFISCTSPYLSHSSLTSSQISETWSVTGIGSAVLPSGRTLIVLVIDQLLGRHHVQKLEHSALVQVG